MNNIEIGLMIFTFAIVLMTFVIQVYKFMKYQGKNYNLTDVMALFTQVMPNIITVFEEYLAFKNNDKITYDDALNYVTVNLIGVLDDFEMNESMRKLITHDNIKTLVDPILGKLWDDFYVIEDDTVDEEETEVITEA